jgi:endoglucanase
MRVITAALLFLLTATGAIAADTPSNAIKVDQVGYPDDAVKIAVVSAPGTNFSVKSDADNKVVYVGLLGQAVRDADTGDTVSPADFTSLRQAGTYYLDVPGVGRSWAFKVGPDVFSRTYYLAMRAFYGQRCGVAVDLAPDFRGYSHPACHLEEAFHASSGKAGKRTAHFGWHDAGDYGRYIPSSAIATGTLLWTWEMFGPRLRDVRLNIPESGNGTPDLLNEARWNLEWMLSMQDDDGGVWQKETSEQFAGFVMPQDDRLPSVVIGTGKAPFKSTCATADLAAVAAVAARVYTPFDQEFARRNLTAARQAWRWAEQYPAVTFKNPVGVMTGEYGDAKCGDERLWAAAELWRTTGEAAYQRYFVDNSAQFMTALESPSGENWADVANMALWTYALAGRSEGDATTLAPIKAKAIEAAHTIAARTRASGYHVSMTAKDYVWGSNGVAANYGMQLLIANRLSPHPEFAEAALDNLHYLLGRNAFSLSWVTQVGANAFKHPHHRPSGADKNDAPWPGLLSGGPNAARQDPVTKSLPELPPAKIYRDDQESYASNEVAINWQAMLVFVLAAQLK